MDEICARHGIPLIECDDPRDGPFAVGFCQGQDRSFQLELSLRVARGNVSEMAGVAALPDSWQGHYNYACFEAREGNPDAAIERLRTAIELHPQAAELARKDEDFDSVRDDERFLAIAGQPDTARTGT